MVSEQGVVWAMNSDRARGAGLCGVWRLLGDVLLEKSMVARAKGLSGVLVGVGGARGSGSTGLGRQAPAEWTGRCVSAGDACAWTCQPARSRLAIERGKGLKRRTWAWGAPGDAP